MSTYDTEVVIVGSGISGALAAYKLAKNGIKVIVLEAGPTINDREKHVERFRAAQVQTPESAYEDFPQAPRPKVADLNGYYVQKGKDLFGSTYERVVGGSTWHWLGSSFRLLPSDFNLAKQYKVGIDWPINYEDLEPYYTSAEHEMRVSGDSLEDLGSPRSKDYVNEAIKQTYLDSTLSKALSSKSIDGLPLDVRSTPQARETWCQGSASCIPICPIKAKYDATAHIEKAVALGATVVDKAVVHNIEIDSNRNVKQIRYLDWEGKEHTISAKRYIVAANAIETVKILLMSKSKYAPNGVANSSDLVGRNLMDHPTQLSWALTEEPIYPFRGPLSTSGIESLRDGMFRSKRSAFRIEIGNDGWTWPTGSPTSDAAEFIKKNLHGDSLKGTLKDRLHRQLRLACLVEQLPNRDNRIIPSSSEFDQLGLPRPEITYNIGDYERAGLAKAKEVNNYIFGLLGAEESFHHDSHTGPGHIMGTYRMGNEPSDSVVDIYSRTHDHKNLFLLGSGVFPSGGAANPTLTIAALTLRTVDTLIKDLK